MMERVYLIDKGIQYNYNDLSNRDETNRVVIHHTGNPIDDDLSVVELNASHQALGWTCVGYHYIIRKDGHIEIGRPHWTVGAHAYGYNSDSIGVHVCGNFDIAKPTDAQIESLAMLLANVCTDYGLPIDEAHVVGHRDLMATACPGNALYNMLPVVRGKAVFYQNA